MRTFILALMVGIIGCGGEPVVDDQEEDVSIQKEPAANEESCGNNVCERNKGEDYWNCLDCVDLLTGGPTNGYCGDGVCFNETMFDCWTDCRPHASNPAAFDDDVPQPGKNIRILIDQGPWPGIEPIPNPGPLPGPPKKEVEDRRW